MAVQLDSGALASLAILNPRALSVTMTGSAVAFTNSPLTISAATCNLTTAVGLVSITTSAAHQLVTGQFVTIVGTTDPRYTGIYAVTVVDATHFTYQLPFSITNNTAFLTTMVTPDTLSGTPQVTYRIMAQRMWIQWPGHVGTIGPTTAGTSIPMTASTQYYFENPVGAKFYLDTWYGVGTNADVVKIVYV